MSGLFSQPLSVCLALSRFDSHLLALTVGQRRIKQVPSCCGALMCSYLHVAVVHAHSFAGSSWCLCTGALICVDSFAHIIFADVCRYLRAPEQLLSLALNIVIAASPQCCSWECNPQK